MTSWLQAIAFTPQHPTGVAVTFSCHADGLQILYEDGTSLAVPCGQLQLRRVGFDEQGIELSWQHGQHTLALQVLARNQVQLLKQLLPPILQQQMQVLQQKHRLHRQGRFILWSLLAGFLLLPILSLLFFWTHSDRFADKVIQHISIPQEQKLGELALKQLQLTQTLQQSGASWQRVERIGRYLTTDSVYTWQFYVVDETSVNAFAMPGGIIVVHQGLLLKVQTAEMLAGVLAHEIQHVEQRHSLQQMVKNLGLQGLWMVVTGDIGAGLGGQMALEFMQLRFSREAEYEADQQGLKLLVQKNIDPQGMLDFFRLLDQEGGQQLPAWLATHPGHEQRLQALQQLIDQLPPTNFAPLQDRLSAPIL